MLLISDMEPVRQEDLSQLSVEEMIGLLDYPREEISSHVHELISNELAKVNGRWLINGLLEQFFKSKSKRLLNMVLDAPEHHWKLLMDNIQEGLKGNEKFRYTSILLYAVCANPPFPWVKKLPDHRIVKDIFAVINPNSEKDVSVVVSGLMFLVVLLPTAPNDMSIHLPKMLDLFLSLMQHTPPDNALKVYLQISVKTFFQRLYALYPCRLIGFLRYHSESKSKYEKTLFPMLEKVRLHPLLLTETKDSEIKKDRWKGKDRHELIQECAQISLDTFIDIPEGLEYAEYFKSKINPKKSAVELGGYLLAKESRIWSPGVMSPARSVANITPIYSSQFSRSMSRSSIPESPLETAVEAISEADTAFDSSFSRDVLTLNPGDSAAVDMREKYFSSAEKDSHYVATGIDINLLHKDAAPVSTHKDCQAENFFGNISAYNHRQSGSSSIDEGLVLSYDSLSEPARKRKSPVYSRDSFQDSTSNIDTIEEELAERDEPSGPNSCDSVCEAEAGNDEGLGVPSRDSWTELMKTVKTKRLRFLSQCGPPPNLSRRSAFNASAINRSEPQTIPKLQRRSRSFPNLADEIASSLSSSFTRKDFSPTLSPSKVEVEDVSTQTEEAAVLDPYVQLLEALQVVPNYSQNIKSSTECFEGAEDNSFIPLANLMKKTLSEQVYSSNVELDWVSVGIGTPNNFKQQLGCLFALLKVEKFKKEAYAERNKRLFSKIKHCSYLCDSQKSDNMELKALRDEVTFLRDHHVMLKTKMESQEQQVGKMTPLSCLQEAQSECDDATTKLQYLKELCKKLAMEKKDLLEEVKCCDGKVEDAKRKMKICAVHSQRNESLTAQLHAHQKQILLMGEIHKEIQSKLSFYRHPDKSVSISNYEELQAKMKREHYELDCENHNKTLKLKVTQLRLVEMEEELGKKDELISKHQEDMKNLERRWQEKYKLATSRNAMAEAGPIVSGFGDSNGGHNSPRELNGHRDENNEYLRVELGSFLRSKMERHGKPEGEQ